MRHVKTRVGSGNFIRNENHSTENHESPVIKILLT